MISLKHTPSGIDEILDYYGTPYDEAGELDPQWYADNTEVFELPVYLVQSWPPYRHITRFRAHRLVGEVIVDAISEIAWLYRERFRDERLDRFGGVFNFRYKRGGDSLSVHSWGIAIDYLPERGQLGSQSDANTYPREIVDIFSERGFEWGGTWSYPDAMHFQACKEY